ncbi:PQQ-dependent sugar dehydrogenase [Microbulbifer sp. EKSA008]|uniref:PQQ-dependent sugar dehydrogenase n=1 Tax=Microbulbifer sp. EKSA008 TaxID=3243367 RepID=UPI004041FB9D
MKYLLSVVVTICIFFSTAANSQNNPLISRGTIPLAEEVTLTSVAGPLEYPWGITSLPDGSFLITQRSGQLRIVKDGKLLANPIEFPAEILFLGQGGLLDIAVSPTFPQDQMLYFSYAIGNMDSNRLAIGRAKWNNGKLENFEEIFKSAQGKNNGAHFGSRLAFLPDKTLLATIGDGGNPPQEFLDIFAREQAQNLQTHFGSIIRINGDGSIPDDNPFKNQADALPQIWSFGHRNPQGLVIDQQSGEIWSSEHGPAGGDELNRLKAGSNYGWPRVTFGRDYRDGSNIAFKIEDPEFTSPALAWLDTHAPGGLAFYTGNAFPEWKGRLISAGLVSEDLRIIQIKDGAAIGELRIPIGERVRDAEVGQDGSLYILTDGPKGRLLRIDPAKQ